MMPLGRTMSTGMVALFRIGRGFIMRRGILWGPGYGRLRRTIRLACPCLCALGAIRHGAALWLWPYVPPVLYAGKIAFGPHTSSDKRDDHETSDDLGIINILKKCHEAGLRSLHNANGCDSRTDIDQTAVEWHACRFLRSNRDQDTRRC